MDRMFLLIGQHPYDGVIESNFTQGEAATALAIAKEWDRKGFRPVLISKTYKGDFKFLYRSVKHLAIKRAA
jgi:hypothetical protein